MQDTSISGVLEKIGDGFYTVNKEFVVTYWNHKSEEYLNVDKETIIGRNLWEIFSQNDCELIYKQHCAALLEDKLQKYEVYYAPLDIWLDVNTYPSPEGLSVFFKNITERKKLETKLQDEVRERQKLLTSAVITTEQKVRTEIGRELHDNINQVLTTAKWYLQTSINPENNRAERINKSIELLEYCVQEIRNLSKELSAPVINYGFEESVKDLVTMFMVKSKARFQLNVSGLEATEISQEVHLAIYRIIQEHLTNVLKHSYPSAILIDIAQSSKRITMEIKDDSFGFNMNLKNPGTGITNMISRTEALNGKFTLSSARGEGCVVRLEIPL